MKHSMAEIVSGQLWVYYKGKTFVYESEAKQRKKGAQALDSEDQIVAPMPGKITAIKCSGGGKVFKDQILIVMEAMKMEYNLKSPRDAEVDRINFIEGDQVNLGDVLICLKK